MKLVAGWLKMSRYDIHQIDIPSDILQDCPFIVKQHIQYTYIQPSTSYGSRYRQR